MIRSREIQSMNELLNSYDFVVPEYQRGYEWQRVNVESFHETILIALENNEDKFIGTVILRQSDNPNGRSQVVDGQQRLTTIVLYLCVLRDLFVELSDVDLSPRGIAIVPPNPYNEVESLLISRNRTAYRFQCNSLVQSIYESYVAPHPTRPVARPPMPSQHKAYTRSFRTAVRTIRGLLLPATPEGQVPESDVRKLDRLYDIFQTICNRLKVLPITADNDAEALDIFMTLNTKGLRLGPSDLIKGNIFSAVLSEATPETASLVSEHLLQQWKEIIDFVEKGDIDQCFRHYFLAFQKESFQTVKIVDRASERIGTSSNGRAQNAIRLLADLKSMSEKYGELLSPNVTVNDKDVRMANEAILCLNRINASARILTLAVLMRNFSSNEFFQIVKRIEALTYRWQFLGRNAQELEKLFQEIAFSVTVEGALPEEICLHLESKIPSDDDCSGMFDREMPDSMQSRVILFRIHQAMGDPSRIVSFDTTVTEVEHIAPQTSTSEWLTALMSGDHGVDEMELEDYESKIERIGNKTILEKHINNQIKQQSFQKKRDGVSMTVGGSTFTFEGYRNSKVDMTADLGNVGSWTAVEIDLRTSWIEYCFVRTFCADTGRPEIEQFSDWVSRVR